MKAVVSLTLEHRIFLGKEECDNEYITSTNDTQYLKDHQFDPVIYLYSDVNDRC